MVPGYSTSTNLLRVYGLSTDPRDLGRHKNKSIRSNSSGRTLDISKWKDMGGDPRFKSIIIGIIF